MMKGGFCCVPKELTFLNLILEDLNITELAKALACVCVWQLHYSMEAKFVIYISINFLGRLTFYLTYPAS